MRVIGVLLFLLVLGCKANTQDTKGSAGTRSMSATQVEETLPFPVYVKFSEFEPALRHKNDTTYVINFWATWCKPCVVELPFFEQLHASFKNKPVKVILVSLDFPRQIKSNLIPFVKERNLQSSIAVLIDMDYNSWIDKVSEEWDGAIPFTLIYNSKYRKSFLGEMPDYQSLESSLLSVMQ